MKPHKTAIQLNSAISNFWNVDTSF